MIGWIQYLYHYFLMQKKPPAMFAIDVSHNNGIIDWAKVATNIPRIDAAILKATEGSTHYDKKFSANVAGCEKNNIPWGAYHFATWNNQDVRTDAIAEASFFIKRVKEVGKPKLPMVLDVETNKPLNLSKDQVYLYIKTFIAELVAAGYDFAIYSSPGFLESYLPTDHKLGSSKLWIAHYTKKPAPRIPFGWKNVWLWQFTDQGKCDGVRTACDLNKTIETT